MVRLRVPSCLAGLVLSAQVLDLGELCIHLTSYFAELSQMGRNWMNLLTAPAIPSWRRYLVDASWYLGGGSELPR